MLRSKILGLGSYVPDRIVTNDDLAHFDNRHVRHAEKQIDITDEWVRERTGVEQRRYVPNDESTTCSDLAQRASLAALEDAGISAKEIDCIIYATLSPDIHFPGSGVFLQTRLGIGGAGTMMWVDPVHDVGLVALTDRSFTEWKDVALQRWPELSDAVVAAAAGGTAAR